MRIAVLVKEVPDTYGDRELVLETGLTRRADVERVLDEVDERALEAAIAYAQEHQGTEVTAVSMGPEAAVDGIRRALAMGADDAVHLADDALAGADLTVTAEALAGMLSLQPYDLVIAGAVSTDGGGGAVAAMVAERLALPLVSALDELDIEEGRVRGRRTVDDVTQTIACALPAIVSVTERMPAARMPSLKGIMGAKKKPYRQLSVADVGIDPDALAPRSIMIAVDRRPPRAQGVTVVDDGTTGAQLAAFLRERGVLA